MGHNDTMIEHFFFVDTRNKIQLLYPNSFSQLDRDEKIKIISNQANLDELDNMKYKRIMYILNHYDEHC